MTPEILHLQKEEPNTVSPIESFPTLSKVEEISQIETAISHLVLVVSSKGGFVYKLRKHVGKEQVGDLCDFTTLAKRKEDCVREIEKNRPMAADLYLGIIPVARRGNFLVFEGEGEIVDWAVKMKKFSQEGKMDNLLRQNKLGEKDILELARVIWRFHQSLSVPPEAGQYGSLQNVTKIWQENFEQTKPFIDKALEEDLIEKAKGEVSQFMEKNAELFKKRIEEGKVLDCHGDLHSDNVIIEKGRVLPFDALEFNKAYSIHDVASEIAFMAMDLEFSGHPDLAGVFVKEYVRLTGDEKMVKSGLLDFYKSHRAWVRGKVESWQGNFTKAKAYFDLASSYLQLSPQMRA